MFSESTKLKVQQFGRFLSNMVMPNIGAFVRILLNDPRERAPPSRRGRGAGPPSRRAVDRLSPGAGRGSRRRRACPRRARARPPGPAGAWRAGCAA